MLRTDEYIDMENKWKDYKKKQLFKIIFTIVSIIIILLLVLAISRLLLFKNQNNTEVDINETNISKTIEMKEINVTQNNNTSITNNNSKTDQTKKIVIDNTTEAKALSIKNSTTTVKKQSDNSEKTKKVINKNITPPKSSDATTKVESKPSNNIIIETKEMNNIDVLIARFEATRNIVFANIISEEYYDKKDYDNSLKWALIANDINSKDERSWVMFGKSKAKQGKDDEAIHALQVFISHSPNSNNAKNLLETLKNGSFK